MPLLHSCVLKNASGKICGYSGLLLPVCEDIGLANRANEQTYNIITYTFIICGLDTVPILGNITIEKIIALLIYMPTLAIKLNQPLSARLFPITNKKLGK